MPRPIVPSNYEVDPGILLDDYLLPDVTYRFDLTTTAESTALFSTENVLGLTQSVHCTTGTVGNSRAGVRPRSDISAFPNLVNIGAGGWFLLPYWKNNTEPQDGVNLAIYETPSVFSKINTGPLPSTTEQNYVLYDALKATAGIVDWNAQMEDYEVELQHLNAGGSPSEIFLNGLCLKPRSRPIVILMFDDGWLGVHTEALPYMAARNLKGSVPVIAGSVDVESDHMTRAQLQDCYNAGWDMNTHGTSQHTALVTYDAIKNDVLTTYDYLIAEGLTRGSLHYTYPGGAVEGNTGGTSEQVLRDCGMLTGSGTSGGTFITARYGIDNPYQLRRAAFSEDSVSNGSFAVELERVVRVGGILLLYSHDIISPVGDALTHITPTSFKAGIDRISGHVLAGELDVVPFSEWWEGL